MSIDEMYRQELMQDDIEGRILKKVALDIRQHLHDKKRANFRHELVARKNIGSLINDGKSFNNVKFFKLVNLKIKRKTVRQVIILTFFSELSQKQIAKRLNKRQATISANKRKGIKLLQSSLRALYFEKSINNQYIVPMQGSKGDHRTIELYKKEKKVKTSKVTFLEYKKIEQQASKVIKYKSTLWDKAAEFYYIPQVRKPVKGKDNIYRLQWVERRALKPIKDKKIENEFRPNYSTYELYLINKKKGKGEAFLKAIKNINTDCTGIGAM